MSDSDWGGCQSGFYTGSVSVSLSATDSGGSDVSQIRYTTNGSDPTITNGTVYNGPFSLTTTTTVKYRAFDNAGNAEAVNSQSIQVSAPDTTPPSSTIACDGSPCQSSAYPAAVSVSLAASDNSGGTGVAADPLHERRLGSNGDDGDGLYRCVRGLLDGDRQVPRLRQRRQRRGGQLAARPDRHRRAQPHDRLQRLALPEQCLPGRRLGQPCGERQQRRLGCGPDPLHERRPDPTATTGTSIRLRSRSPRPRPSSTAPSTTPATPRRSTTQVIQVSAPDTTPPARRSPATVGLPEQVYPAAVSVSGAATTAAASVWPRSATRSTLGSHYGDRWGLVSTRLRSRLLDDDLKYRAFDNAGNARGGQLAADPGRARPTRRRHSYDRLQRLGLRRTRTTRSRSASPRRLRQRGSGVAQIVYTTDGTDPSASTGPSTRARSRYGTRDGQVPRLRQRRQRRGGQHPVVQIERRRPARRSPATASACSSGFYDSASRSALWRPATAAARASARSATRPTAPTRRARTAASTRARSRSRPRRPSSTAPSTTPATPSAVNSQLRSRSTPPRLELDDRLQRRRPARAASTTPRRRDAWRPATAAARASPRSATPPTAPTRRVQRDALHGLVHRRGTTDRQVPRLRQRRQRRGGQLAARPDRHDRRPLDRSPATASPCRAAATGTPSRSAWRRATTAAGRAWRRSATRPTARTRRHERDCLYGPFSVSLDDDGQVPRLRQRRQRRGGQHAVDPDRPTDTTPTSSRSPATARPAEQRLPGRLGHLAASDNSGGSGVAQIRYTSDGSDPTATTGLSIAAAFAVCATTTVKYRAFDNAGNPEPVNSPADPGRPPDRRRPAHDHLQRRRLRRRVQRGGQRLPGGRRQPVAPASPRSSTPRTAPTQARSTGPLRGRVPAYGYGDRQVPRLRQRRQRRGGQHAARSRSIRSRPARRSPATARPAQSGFYNASVSVSLAASDSRRLRSQPDPLHDQRLRPRPATTGAFYTGSFPLRPRRPSSTAPSTTPATPSPSTRRASRSTPPRQLHDPCNGAPARAASMARGQRLPRGKRQRRVGVQKIVYTTDGSTRARPTAGFDTAFPLSATATVKYRACDNAGNVEPSTRRCPDRHTPPPSLRSPAAARVQGPYASGVSGLAEAADDSSGRSQPDPLHHERHRPHEHDRNLYSASFRSARRRPSSIAPSTTSATPRRSTPG